MYLLFLINLNKVGIHPPPLLLLLNLSVPLLKYYQVNVSSIQNIKIVIMKMSEQYQYFYLHNIYTIIMQ